MSAPSSNSDFGLPDALHPPDFRPRLLHLLLVLSAVVGRISPLALTPAWLALGAVACWPWGRLRTTVAAASVAFVLLDGVGLALLPRLGRSFGPVTPPLLALTIARVSLTLTAALLWGTGPALVALTAVQLGISAVSLYATWIEPFRIEITQAELCSPALDGPDRVHVLHISDLHVERVSPREKKLLSLVALLDPDLIVLTGDYLNLSSVHDSESQSEVRQLLGDLCDASRAPVYAIPGSPPVDLSHVVPRIFEGLPIIWLNDEVADIVINDQDLRLAGLRCTGERSRDAPRLRDLLASTPDGKFTVLLYHSPDLMPEALELGVDLYLCGHTHGGQIRVPLFGALITSSEFRKRYEMGRYEENGTTLYVSRGLGMEGLGAPRARFLSPPEIVHWTLSAADEMAR